MSAASMAAKAVFMMWPSGYARVASSRSPRPCSTDSSDGRRNILYLLPGKRGAQGEFRNRLAAAICFVTRVCLYSRMAAIPP